MWRPWSRYPRDRGAGREYGHAGDSGVPPRTVDLGVLGGLRRGVSRSRGPRTLAPLTARSQGGIAYTPLEYASSVHEGVAGASFD